MMPMVGGVEAVKGTVGAYQGRRGNWVAVGRRGGGAGRTGGDDEATAALKVKSTEVIAAEAERS